MIIFTVRKPVHTMKSLHRPWDNITKLVHEASQWNTAQQLGSQNSMPTVAQLLYHAEVLDSFQYRLLEQEMSVPVLILMHGTDLFCILFLILWSLYKSNICDIWFISYNFVRELSNYCLIPLISQMAKNSSDQAKHSQHFYL